MEWNFINCKLFLFAASWFFIIGAAFDESFNGGSSLNSTATFFYAMAWIGVVVSIVALYKSKKASISIVGPVLCLIGNLAFGLAAAFAFPAIVLLIIGTVFSFLQKPDLDNSVKLLQDCMTSLGFWEDDRFIVSLIVEKFWTDIPGIFIQIEVVDDELG